MLLPNRIAQGVRDGAITLAFRRWEQPRVKVGGTQLTSAGIVRFDAVEEVLGSSDLTDDDARAAGFAGLRALRRQLFPATPATPSRRGPRAGKGGDHVYRVHLSWVGEDPRLALREVVPDADDLAALRSAVTKLDASKRTGAVDAADPGVDPRPPRRDLHRAGRSAGP